MSAVKQVLVLGAVLVAGRAVAEECGAKQEPSPGLVVEKVAAPGGAGCLTVVRIDPAKFALRVLSGHGHGGSRSAADWARDFGLTGVTNASMYAPDERSIGILVGPGTRNREHDNPRLGAFLAFDPVDATASPVVLVGRDCPGFDLAALRKRYRSIVQNYRMLGCDGKPLPWKDSRRHAAAAVGTDAAGRVVFVHSRTALQVAELARALAELRLAAAMYVEGGREAVLWLRSGELALGEGFLGGAVLRVPNVLGFAPLTSMSEGRGTHGE